MKPDGISPIIGMILMVVITVILAALMAAFVFGMGDINRLSGCRHSCDSNLSIEFMDGQFWNTTVKEFCGEYHVRDNALVIGETHFPFDNIRRWTLDTCITEVWN